jgi:hypothetical protein
MRTSFQSLLSVVHARLQEHKDTIGFNVATLRHYEQLFSDEQLPTADAGAPVAAPKTFRLGKRKDVSIF